MYDKEGVFLGMDQKALSFLGFQDFNEFKSYCNDPADMFEKRLGYISKFKNFSWIDYAMHSGAPNKNVIIKSKNEKELEARVDISEIFLMNKFEDKSVIYSVELNSILNNDIKISDVDSTKNLATGVKPQVSFSNTDLEDVLSDNKIELEDIQEDYKSKDEIQNQTDINEEIQKEAVIFNDEEFKPNIKLKVDFENTHKEAQNINVDINNKDEIFGDNLEEVDFAQIAEDTDLDLEDIVIFLNEFMDEAKNILKNINESENTQSLDLSKSNFIKLKGIAIQLKMDNIVKIIDLIIKNINKNSFNNSLKIFETQIKNLEGELL